METEDSFFNVSIAEAARALASGAASSLDLTCALLSRIEAKNPVLNAFAFLDREGALAAAKASDDRRSRGLCLGPLDGIALTVKDNYETAGIQSRAGSPRYKGNIPLRDAELVRRLKAVGALVLGKTNLPPLAMDAQCANPLTGRTNNPWDTSKTPGGSSGGGAAAVASGMSYADLCNDLLGSIRLPAHYCGVCGFMPSESSLPLAGILPRPAGSRPQAATATRFLRPGFLARSIEDIEILLSACAGPSPEEPLLYPGALARRADGEASGAEPRIAYCRSLGSVPIDPEYARAFDAGIARISEKGFAVRQLPPDWIDAAALKECFNRIFFGAQAAAMGAPLRLIMRIAMRDRSLFSLDMRRYLAAESERAAQMIRADEVFAQSDLVLLPVSSTSAFGHRRTGRPIEVGGKATDYSKATIGLTFPFNVLGNPVLSMPFARTESGLPLGLQVVGRRFSDLRLLAQARFLFEKGLCLGPRAEAAPC
jgi:amidase